MDNRYDTGINNDSYVSWRNSGDIGYVQLAFKVITEAIYDLIAGDHNQIMSAHFFFYGEESESLYRVWAMVLGNTDLPIIVKRYKLGQVSQEDVEYIRNLCTTVKTI